MLIVAAVALLVIVGLPLAWYNKLVRLRQLIRESWGNVDVQLRRRYDLIPNLVATVKGYATHEREVLERVIEARNRAQANRGAVGSQSEDERRLVDATKQLFAVVESYPQLKASANFLALQKELVDTEENWNTLPGNSLRVMPPGETSSTVPDISSTGRVKCRSFMRMTDSRVLLTRLRIFSYSISSSVFPCACLPTICRKVLYSRE